MSSAPGGKLHYGADYTRNVVGRELRSVWKTAGLPGLFDIAVLNTVKALIQDLHRALGQQRVTLTGRQSFKTLSLRQAVFCRASASPLGLRLANVVSKMNGPRIVEVALAKSFVSTHKGQRVAEIGNVMGYYMPLPDSWEVFDKYESGEHVTSADIVDLVPPPRFDVVVTISTLEHVGWDEDSRDPRLFLVAIRNFCSLVAPGGEGLVTVPLHYNPVVDDWGFGSPPRGFTFHYVAPLDRWLSWTEIDRNAALRDHQSMLIAFFKSPAEG